MTLGEIPVTGRIVEQKIVNFIIINDIGDNASRIFVFHKNSLFSIFHGKKYNLILKQLRVYQRKKRKRSANGPTQNQRPSDSVKNSAQRDGRVAIIFTMP